MPSMVFPIRITLWFVSALLLASCSGSGAPYPYEVPPAGTFNTPYWYTIHDSLFWYVAADSLALLQMSQESTPGEHSATLIAARALGWRMAVQRSAGLSRAADPQELSQTLYAVERAGEAASPIAQYGKFQQAFWSAADTTLTGVLPGLRLLGLGPPQYYWPSALIVVWKPGMSEAQARAVMDSLGFVVLKSIGLSQYYYVERSWTVYLPAGAELFTWLRWFNRDVRVHMAYPALGHREPPLPDHRVARIFPPRPDTLVPAGVKKLTPLLQTAWELATFCDHTDYVEDNTGLAANSGRLRVLLRGSIDLLKSAIEAAGGEVIVSGSNSIEAWVPYATLPGLAAQPAVTAVEEVKSPSFGQ